MTVIKYLSSSILLAGLILLALLFDHHPVLIQSRESKTLEDKPVYNQISYFSNQKQDVWMMNQSHHGLNAEAQKWDRLAIVIDKNKNPKEVTFLQLPPGELKWEEDLLKQKINYKVSCFMCHSNGPRAIRADEKSLYVSTFSKAKVFVWNLRIKTYGSLTESRNQLAFDKKLEVPFRHRYPTDNVELELKSCTKCHNGQIGWKFRNKLTRQNNIMIQFMIQNQLMPPLGYSLSESDRKELNKFLRGI